MISYPQNTFIVFVLENMQLVNRSETYANQFISSLVVLAILLSGWVGWSSSYVYLFNVVQGLKEYNIWAWRLGGIKLSTSSTMTLGGE